MEGGRTANHKIDTCYVTPSKITTFNPSWPQNKYEVNLVRDFDSDG